jgi:putative tricarboxylic transport membrane protein
MRNHDRWSGVFWVLLAIFFCIKSSEAGIGTFRSPGSGFLPFWAGVIFGLLGLILVGRTLFGRDPAVKGEGSNETRWPKVGLVLLSLFLYAWLLEKVGFLIMTFALLTLLFGMVGKSKFWVRVVNALITTLVTYVIFYVCLNVPLPRGLIDGW